MSASTLALVPTRRTTPLVTSAAAESVADVTVITLEALVARDISDYSLRRRARTTSTESRAS